jgi:hypothetical protein
MKAIIKTGLSFLLLLAGLTSQASEFENGSQKLIDRPVAGDPYIAGGTVLVNAGIAGGWRPKRSPCSQRPGSWVMCTIGSGRGLLISGKPW